MDMQHKVGNWGVIKGWPDLEDADITAVASP